MLVSTSDKPLIWIGSKRDLMGLPVWVRKFFGHALDFAQRGGRHNAAKALKGFGGAGVLEVVEDDEGGTLMKAAPIVPSTPSSLSTPCLCFTASRRKANRASRRPRKTSN